MVSRMIKVDILMPPSPLRYGIEDILTNRITEVTISRSFLINLEDIDMKNLGDLLIVAINENIDYFKAIDLYQSKNKKIIAWVEHPNDTSVLDIFKKGLNGYIYAGIEVNELTQVISSILQGGNYIHPVLSSVLLKDYIKLTTAKVQRPEGVLTTKEWLVMEALVNGYTNKEIAESLLIAEDTVKNHVSSIFKKLNVANRANAIIVAFKKGWFDFKDPIHDKSSSA